MNNQIQPHNEQGGLARVEPSIGEMMEMALKTGVSPDSIKALCDAFVQMEDRKNAREFSQAMAKFQTICTPVKPDATRVLNKAGAKVPYATLEAIQRHIAKPLAECGLSYSFSQDEDKGRVKVTCLVRHDNGHTQPYTFTAVAGSASGATPDVTNLMATKTAMRRAIALAFAFVIGDIEDGPDEAEDAPLITPEQVREIRNGITETNRNEAKLLAYFGASKIEDLRQYNYQPIMLMIDDAREALKRKATR